MPASVFIKPTLALLVAIAAADSTAANIRKRKPSVSLCSSVSEGPRAFTSSFLSKVFADDGTSGSFSPASLRQAWFMVGQGTPNDSADNAEIRDTLESCMDDIAFTELATRIARLESSSDDFSLAVANAAFVEQTFPVEQSYLDAIQSSWGAKVANLDFRNDATSARQTINDFVSNKTNGVIPQILDADPDSKTALFLVNALYFNAKWKTKFADGASNQLFIDHSKKRTVKAMAMTEIVSDVAYYEWGTYTAATLPYKEDGYEMLLIRPKDCIHPDTGSIMGLSTLVGNGDDSYSLDTVLRKAMTETSKEESHSNVRVTLPRFHVQWRAESRLKLALQDLGLNTVFDPNLANFSGISTEAELYVSDIIHQADVRVHEDGTEAAAATAVGMSLTSMPLEPPHTIRFDVPFLYAIFHRPTESVLFAGWVNIDALEIEESEEVDYEGYRMLNSLESCAVSEMVMSETVATKEKGDTKSSATLMRVQFSALAVPLAVIMANLL